MEANDHLNAQPAINRVIVEEEIDNHDIDLVDVGLEANEMINNLQNAQPAIDPAMEVDDDLINHDNDPVDIGLVANEMINNLQNAEGMNDELMGENNEDNNADGRYEMNNPILIMNAEEFSVNYTRQIAEFQVNMINDAHDSIENFATALRLVDEMRANIVNLQPTIMSETEILVENNDVTVINNEQNLGKFKLIFYHCLIKH